MSQSKKGRFGSSELDAEVRKLRTKKGWDPTKLTREEPLEALQRLDQEYASQEAYDGSSECPDCVALRESSGDPSALCDVHLARAMGF